MITLVLAKCVRFFIQAICGASRFHRIVHSTDARSRRLVCCAQESVFSDAPPVWFVRQARLQAADARRRIGADFFQFFSRHRIFICNL